MAPMNREWTLDRRGFLKAAALAAAAAGSAAMSGCGALDGYAELVTGERTIVDDAGRELTVPASGSLERIYFTSGLAQVWVFSLNPDKQGGTAAQFSSAQLEYLPEEMRDLAYMGAISENAQIDTEMLLAEDIQLIFSISGVELTESNISDAETLQEQTGIPVVLVDGSFSRIADAYRFVGDIMGEKARAEELARYCERKVAEVLQAVDEVPELERTRIYYAEGPQGLQTDSGESQHALTFKLAGAVNVAEDVEVAHWGMTQVDLEQVLGWDPEVIFAWSEEYGGGADQMIRSMSEWAQIRAVQDGRVYAIPALPFQWCDRPPGVNRLIGIMWVANVLYPDYYDVDMVDETREFYKKMYRVEITEEQARGLLGNSYPARSRA